MSVGKGGNNVRVPPYKTDGGIAFALFLKAWCKSSRPAFQACPLETAKEGQHAQCAGSQSRPRHRVASGNAQPRHYLVVRSEMNDSQKSRFWDTAAVSKLTEPRLP